MTAEELLSRIDCALVQLRKRPGTLERPLLVFVDREIVQEIADKVNIIHPFGPYDMRVAGLVLFWIRKLKPISYIQKTADDLDFVNELVAISVGSAICRVVLKAAGRIPKSVSNTLVPEWAESLRYNSHSPHSCKLTFEFLFS